MLQEYPSGVYQPGPLFSEPNIRLIKPLLEIVDSPFTSSDIMNLKLFLPTSGIPMNITILYYPISYITYISQVTSIPIYNEEPSLGFSDVQIIRYKFKRARFSSMMLTMAWRHPYTLTSFE